MNEVLMETNFPDFSLFKRGKVRDTYDLGNGQLLMVATDRISTFDYVHPTGIPDKGRILTQLSAFWFDFTRRDCCNHVTTLDVDKYFKGLGDYINILQGRSMVVSKTKVIPIECVVRGYLSGSGWKDYKNTRSVCGIKLPEGLIESDKLEEPIFTPATKAQAGLHDENMSFDRMAKIVGKDLASKIRKISLHLYKKAAEYALKKGIIIADTKFEFGLIDNTLFLIDELLTPDSSRFWPADQYKPGRPQSSFDKQFVRDFVESISWRKMKMAPELPYKIVQKTRKKYIEAYERLTGKKFE